MSVNFCKNFVTLRKQNGYTQERIAEKCGVSRQAITKWECGSSLPDMYKLVEIAKLFDVSIDDLICGNCYSPLKALPMMNELLERLLAKTENIERNINTAQDVSDELVQVYYDQLNVSEEERETWRYILEEHLDATPLTTPIAKAPAPVAANPPTTAPVTAETPIFAHVFPLFNASKPLLLISSIAVVTALTTAPMAAPMTICQNFPCVSALIIGLLAQYVNILKPTNPCPVLA